MCARDSLAALPPCSPSPCHGVQQQILQSSCPTRNYLQSSFPIRNYLQSSCPIRNYLQSSCPIRNYLQSFCPCPIRNYLQTFSPAGAASSQPQTTLSSSPSPAWGGFSCVNGEGKENTAWKVPPCQRLWDLRDPAEAGGFEGSGAGKGSSHG